MKSRAVVVVVWYRYDGGKCGMESIVHEVVCLARLIFFDGRERPSSWSHLLFVCLSLSVSFPIIEMISVKDFANATHYRTDRRERLFSALRSWTKPFDAL